MIPQETVDRILDTARIEDIVGDFVTLKRRGASLIACCPFHNEKTPSFYVTPAKGIYKCFGCGKAGGAVNFLMDYEHLSYVDALKYIAQRYHIEIVEEEVSAEELAQKQRRESLILVSEFAASFFAGQLGHGEGKAVGYSYFKSRHIEDETISKFGLGWAPEGKTVLIDAALKAGYKIEYLLDAGLAVKREDGSVADKFRGRAMFPIHTVSGRVIAFSGRTLHADVGAKYLNTADTEIYTKSKVLLGIYFAKSEIARQRKCIVVEGNVDMVMMHQLGLTNVVAPCGTALTAEQVHLIHRFCDDLTIMFDGDKAGIKAALGKIDMVLSEGMNVRIVLLPDGEDPDSFCKSHTLEEVRDYIDSHEQDFVDFKAAMLLRDVGSDPIRKAAVINEIADTVAAVPDAVQRSVYVEKISDKFRIDSAILFERIAARRQQKIEEDRMREDRDRRRIQAGLPPAPEYGYPGTEQETKASIESGRVFEDPIVEKSENELLSFIIANGGENLDFESDSNYFAGNGMQKQSVASFITDAIDPDGGHMLNSCYDKVYQEYVRMMGEGLSHDRIVRDLLNSRDPDVAFVSAQLSTQKYILSVKSFRDSMTSKSSWLANYVPKAIIVYAGKKAESKISSISRSLSDRNLSEERQESLMKELLALQEVLRLINTKIKNR